MAPLFKMPNAPHPYLKIPPRSSFTKKKKKNNKITQIKRHVNIAINSGQLQIAISEIYHNERCLKDASHIESFLNI